MQVSHCNSPVERGAPSISLHPPSVLIGNGQKNIQGNNSGDDTAIKNVVNLCSDSPPTTQASNMNNFSNDSTGNNTNNESTVEGAPSLTTISDLSNNAFTSEENGNNDNNNSDSRSSNKTASKASDLMIEKTLSLMVIVQCEALLEFRGGENNGAAYNVIEKRFTENKILYLFDNEIDGLRNILQGLTNHEYTIGFFDQITLRTNYWFLNDSQNVKRYNDYINTKEYKFRRSQLLEILKKEHVSKQNHIRKSNIELNAMYEIVCVINNILEYEKVAMVDSLLAFCVKYNIGYVSNNINSNCYDSKINGVFESMMNCICNGYAMICCSDIWNFDSETSNDGYFEVLAITESGQSMITGKKLENNAFIISNLNEIGCVSLETVKIRNEENLSYVFSGDMSKDADNGETIESQNSQDMETIIKDGHNITLLEVVNNLIDCYAHENEKKNGNSDDNDDSDENESSNSSDSDIEANSNFQIVLQPVINRLCKLDFIKSPFMGNNSMIELLNDYNMFMKYMVDYLSQDDMSKIIAPFSLTYINLEQTLSLLNSFVEAYIEPETEYQNKMEEQSMKLF